MTFPEPVKRLYPYVMLVAYGAFLCCYFFLEDYSGPYRFFGRFLFVLGLFVIAAGIRGVWRHPVFLTMVAYMAWLLLSGFWSTPLDWYQLGQKYTTALYIFGFIAITYYLVDWNRDLYERMLQVCTLVAAASALASIVIFYSEHSFPDKRLLGIGSLTNSNEFSTVYSVFALLAASFALRSEHAPLKFLLLLTVGIFICFAWFGQSRTVLVALLATLLALSATTLKERKVLLWLMPVLLVAALAVVFPGSAEGAWHRGLGLRPQIWAALWSEALSNPILGHGLVSPILVAVEDKTFANAHSAYLQVFWQGGIIGLGLFVLLLGMALYHAWVLGARRDNYMIFYLLFFAAIAFTTDLDTLIARPREQWLLFWFPLALLYSYATIGATPSSAQGARS